MASAPGHHRAIMVGLVGGTLAGLGAHELRTRVPDAVGILDGLTDAVAYPAGQIFLRLLFIVVVPLVFASIAAGVARIASPAALGRMGMRTFGCFAVTMCLSAVLGVTAMRMIGPGEGFDPAVRDELMSAFSGDVARIETASQAAEPVTLRVRITQILDAVLPRNILGAVTQLQMLPLIVLALLTGFGLSAMAPDRRERAASALEIVADAMIAIVGLAMRLAPIAVFCLIFVVVERFGLQLLGKLAMYVGVVIGCYLIQMLILYPALIRALTGRGGFATLKSCIPLMVTAFSTSSSSATLPTTIRTAERDLGIRPAVAGFVLPLGATINMNGTALFEGCVVLFVAQIFGIELTLAQQFLVVLLCVVTSVGAAGIPGGSLPLLMLVMAQVGVPPAGLAIILGVDRILDMGRTVVNVMGDVVAAVYVESGERRTA
ncbi:MAG: dicarboxylate/amino acid:cation symporter [Phycisphaerales bacterium]|nr:dicarboxylate/amino acid:cation symporter [Phycisphaerales bacterium]